MLTTIKLMSRQRTPQGKSIKKRIQNEAKKNNLREKCTGKNISNYISLLFRRTKYNNSMIILE